MRLKGETPRHYQGGVKPHTFRNTYLCKIFDIVKFVSFLKVLIM